MEERFFQRILQNNFRREERIMEGFFIGLGIPLIILVVFLIVFRKKLRATREKEGSIYQKIFKRKEN